MDWSYNQSQICDQIDFFQEDSCKCGPRAQVWYWRCTLLWFPEWAISTFGGYTSYKRWWLLASPSASKRLLDKREDGLLTSHLNNLGDSLTCLLQDCLSIPRLSWVRSEMWLAMLQGAACDPVTKKTFPIWVAVKTSVNSWDHPTFLVCDQNWEKERYCLRSEVRKRRVSLFSFPKLYRRQNDSNIGGFNVRSYTLATCMCSCPVLIASKRLLDKRKGMTSHFTLEQLGWFSDMSASRLPEYSSLPWTYLTCREYGQWKGGLAILQASCATASHVLGQTNAAGVGIMSQDDSWMFHSTFL